MPALLRAFAAAMALGAVTAAGGASDPVSAQEGAEQFFRGKSINLYIGSSPRRGHDTYPPVLAHHFGEYNPGHPAILPQNMPGARTHKLADVIYSRAPT